MVFCQLVPWRLDYEKDYKVKTNFRRASFAVTRILANMGAAGEGVVLKNASEPVADAKEAKR